MEFKHRKLSLRKNFSWMFVSTLVYSLARWGMLIVVAKLGKPSDVGLWVLAQAVCLPVMWLSSLNLRAALVTDARDEYTYGQYLGLRLFTAAIMVLVTTGIVLVAGYDWSTKGLIILFGVGAAILSVREIIVAIVTKNECMNISARSNMLLAFASLTVLTGVFYISQSLTAVFIVLIVTRLGVMLLHDVPSAKSVIRAFCRDDANASLRPDWSGKMLFGLFLTALPLGLAMTLWSLNNSIPVYFLEHYHGKEATGYYGAMASIVMATMLLMNALGTASVPRLAKYFIENRRAFMRLVCRLQLIGAVIGVAGVGVAILFGRQILTIAFKPEYAAYSGDFVWMIAFGGVMFMVSFLIYSIMATRAFVYLLVAYGLVLIVCAILSILLIEPYGVSGVVWTRLITAAVALVVLAGTLALIVRRNKPPGLSSSCSDRGVGLQKGTANGPQV